MIIIPLGVDCQVTFVLRDNFLRNAAWPFDWVVTYNGVSDIIKSKFQNYIPNVITDSANEQTKISANTYFMHNTFPNDASQLQRRIDRFLELLQTAENEILFIRRGHSHHHHQEADDFGVTIKNDILDCQELYDHLTETYPKLKFKIILILVCGHCFDPQTTYVPDNKRINLEIHNIAHLHRDDDKFKHFFEKKILGI